MSDRERASLLAAFDSNWIAPLGPEVNAFEADLARRIGVADAAALSSGTAALHLALVLLDVGSGDEVWTSTLTFAATANAIRYVGATPVFIDSERESWNMDPALLREALRDARFRGAHYPKRSSSSTSTDSAQTGSRSSRHARSTRCPVIEDAAEALGATYGGRPAGSFGKIGVLSFNGNKIITTSGGGALLADDPALVERARHLASQARQPAAHYEHEEVGYNYRLSNLLAAVGRAQLARLDGFVERRREINRRYRAALEGIDGIAFLPEAPGGRSNCWLTCVLLDEDRLGVGLEQVREHLETHNIEARPVWKPMHLQPVYRGCRVIGGAVAEDFFRRGLCLPSGSSLSNEGQQRVIDAFLGPLDYDAARHKLVDDVWIGHCRHEAGSP